MSEPVLEAVGLSKTYPLGVGRRSIHALADLSMQVQSGEVFGLVGPNGAGKSTTIKLFIGLIRATAGHATIGGHPAGSRASRARLGYLPENPALYDFLTPVEFMRVIGRLHGLSSALIRTRAERLLELVGLSHAHDLTIRKYSKGMVQRLGLAQALMGDPALVILDEPMSGLDPIGRKDVRDLIFKLRDEGRTVFFSTHILPDVEMICDRVALLSKGRLTDQGKLAELLSNRVRSVEVAVLGLPAAAADKLRKERAVRERDGALLAQFPTLDEANQFVAEVVPLGARVEALNVVRENLEDLFMRRAEEAREVRR